MIDLTVDPAIALFGVCCIVVALLLIAGAIGAVQMTFMPWHPGDVLNSEFTRIIQALRLQLVAGAFMLYFAYCLLVFSTTFLHVLKIPGLFGYSG